MEIINNNPTFTGKDLIIRRNSNQGRSLLYNEVLDIIKNSPVPATVTPEFISINPSKGSNNIHKVMGDLTKAGINFDTIA